MIACMGNRLRPARRASPTTDTRRQTHSRSRGYQSSDGSPVSRWERWVRGHYTIGLGNKALSCRGFWG